VEAERGKRDPGMVMEALRRRAAGRGCGEGERDWELSERESVKILLVASVGVCMLTLFFYGPVASGRLVH
jgi:hypothetical protein